MLGGDEHDKYGQRIANAKDGLLLLRLALERESGIDSPSLIAVRASLLEAEYALETAEQDLIESQTESMMPPDPLDMDPRD